MLKQSEIDSLETLKNLKLAVLKAISGIYLAKVLLNNTTMRVEKLEPQGYSFVLTVSGQLYELPPEKPKEEEKDPLPALKINSPE